MKRYSVILLFLLFGFCEVTHAQQARNGTSAAPQLMIPVDARYLGGGGAAAIVNGIESVTWNPAGLDQGPGNIQVMIARRNYIADIGVNFAAVGLRFGELGAIAVHLRNFAIGEIEQTDEFNMDGTGETFTPVFFTLGATYSRAMTDRINIGVTTNLVYESFSNVNSSAVTLDAGVQYLQFLGVEGLRIGVAIRNIGTSMRYDGSPLIRDAEVIDADRPITKYKVTAAEADMPTVVDLAVSYNVWQGLNMGLTYTENTYAPSEVRALATYDFYGYLTIRGSYNFSVEDQGELENIFDRPSVGATLNLRQVIGMDAAFDYGFMPVRYFDATHAFAFRASF